MGESGRTERRGPRLPDVCRHMCPVPQPVRSLEREHVAGTGAHWMLYIGASVVCISLTMLTITS